jgi:hypothetical protein
VLAPHADAAAEPPRTTSLDQENASAVNGVAKPEFTAATPGAEDERGNETAMSDQPHSPLAGLGVEKAIPSSLGVARHQSQAHKIVARESGRSSDFD